MLIIKVCLLISLYMDNVIPQSVREVYLIGERFRLEKS